MAFPAVCPHDPIEQIGKDVFMARGSVNLNPVVRICRNMAILRHEGELTLVDPVRLNDTELARLDELGRVTKIVRLGAFHGMDDPFYMDRYAPEFWSQPGGKTYTEPNIDVVIDNTTQAPVPDGQFILFEKTKEPECMLLLEREGGLLLTCDGIQHYGDYSNNNFLARMMLPFIGFPKRTIVGPFWMKLMTPDGETLKPEFDRFLAKYSFDKLLAAHGTFLTAGAHASVTAAVEAAYG